MGIVTPLILSIVVYVALRLLSYTIMHPDRIVHGNQVRSYRTWKLSQIVSYMGFDEGKGIKSKRGSPTCLRSEVKSKRNNKQLKIKVGEREPTYVMKRSNTAVGVVEGCAGDGGMSERAKRCETKQSPG